MTERGVFLGVLAAGLLACGGGDASIDAGFSNDGASPDAWEVIDGGPSSDAENCEPPDMLIVLDRTMSMHRKPDGDPPPNTTAGHELSKWYLAITSLEAATATLDQTIRFGLELFPRDPGGDACVTLTERIDGTTATNTACEAGEVLVHPEIGTSAVIAVDLDPETTRLCTSTPIGAGLGTAITELASVANPIREQYALLLTDGQDTCDEALSLANAQALAAAGVNLYVIGFDGSGSGVDNGHLNDLACAGQTAPGFPAPCTDDGSGNYTATNPDGVALYFLAEDETQLVDALEQVAGEICCNCIE